ncbi:hypothetical protein [Methylobacterium gregans]|uniref:Uncharacterized protein n=1 Tax=Methylobacterium gregans TaxID=374424 RepID=A0AA37HPQ4_9HYPH|nr:hypothetical protein [Methylobacterium gregans]MDQ0523790.1 chromosome segregation ATPase [Methylobacterium gregans]GJD79389.1 hypothetical protein NBEOAGPD_2615 [Methylobacterium gregans]GLS54767.1 hypothetical protein GCM10007886_29510 [Methylobacterium gregans]
MSAILDIIFPKRKKAAPSSAEIAAEIDARKAALADANARSAASKTKRQAALDALDEAGIAAAERDADAARISAEVASRALGDLEAAHAEQVKREAADALTARKAATERRLAGEVPRLLADYDRQAAQLAETLEALREIETEALTVNEALHRAGRRDEALQNIQRRYRFEAGKQEPDRVEIVEEWHERDPDGSWSRAVQLVRDKETGEMTPRYGGRKVKREVRHPGRKRPDTYLAPLTGISLPAGRIGGAHHWPRGE